MTKFKVGDKVTVIPGLESRGNEREISSRYEYSIIDIIENNNYNQMHNRPIGTSWIRLDGMSGMVLCADRFKLLKPKYKNIPKRNVLKE